MRVAKYPQFANGFDRLATGNGYFRLIHAIDSKNLFGSGLYFTESLRLGKYAWRIFNQMLGDKQRECPENIVFRTGSFSLPFEKRRRKHLLGIAASP